MGFLHPTTRFETKKVHEELIQNISREVTLDPSYLLLLIFSSIIATLGLLTDSAAVVIGAMLISPLFWPIMGLSMSVVTTRRHLLRRSGWLFLLSILIVLVVSFLTTKATPITGIGDEITSRINPTLIDLFIALATSVIGVLAIYHPRISQSATGVALSMTLLPALCVTGIGMALHQENMISGSLLLFAANTSAIIFAGVLTLYFLKFRPKKEVEQTRFEFGLLLSSIFIVGLSVPLGIYLLDKLDQSTLSTTINDYLGTEIQTVIEGARVEDVQIFPLETDEGKGVAVQATVYVPEGKYLTVGQQNQIINQLSQQVGRSINLNLKIINTISLRKIQDEKQKQVSIQVQEYVRNELKKINPELYIDTIEINSGFNAQEDPIEVVVIVKQLDSAMISFQDQVDLNNNLEEKFDAKFNLNIELLPTTKLVEENEVSGLKKEMDQILLTEIQAFVGEGYIDRSVLKSSIHQDSLLPESYVLEVGLRIPEEAKITENLVNSIQQQIIEQTKVYVDLKIDLVRYETISY